LTINSPFAVVDLGAVKAAAKRALHASASGGDGADPDNLELYRAATRVGPILSAKPPDFGFQRVKTQSTTVLRSASLN